MPGNSLLEKIKEKSLNLRERGFHGRTGGGPRLLWATSFRHLGSMPVTKGGKKGKELPLEKEEGGGGGGHILGVAIFL